MATTTILMAGSYSAWAGMNWLKNVISPLTNSNAGNLKQKALNDAKIASGLREALLVGIDKTIALTGKADGFFGNQAIKINLPQQLQLMDKALRMAGYGPKVDEFVLSMNRAAEKAAPLVRGTFINAIMGMTFDDAQGIRKGGNTAATEYFKGKTRQPLQKLFMPVVNQKLTELDVIRRYNDLLGTYQTLPFASKFPAPSINEYVVSKSLDGIFYTLGQQEQAIRQDPAARVTDLLRQVFK
jgi:hypothetical protein